MNEMLTLMENRSNFYRFLSRIFRTEPDSGYLEELSRMQFPADTGSAELDEGYAELSEYLKNRGENAEEDLACDYARVFLGAGIAEGTVAYPFESVYTSSEHLVMQKAWEEVFGIYREKGVGKSALAKSDKGMYEDHITMELDFMGYLCGEAAAACRREDEAALGRSLAEQKDFLEKHLLNWNDAFLADVLGCSSTGFYKAAARMTNGFLKLDRGMLEELTQAE